MLTDLEIAQQAHMKKIKDIAFDLGLNEDEFEEYGHYKAKLSLNLLKKENKGKVILVTAISPTKAGEGKSTATIGLADAFKLLGKNVSCCVREPSFGPVMGVKGGATGGGYSQVVPMEDINLHFTGDIHAITAANNAISALLDNHIYQGNSLRIDPQRIVWKRCLDMNDRSLRNIIIGLGGKTNGVTREDHFDITVASEVMAVLCLSSDFNDLKLRLGRMVIAYNYDKIPVTLNDLQATGAIALILKDAIKPNLVQTLEHTPVLIHGGPFANIAHGCNSLIATNIARKLTDYVITEAGFGADLGAEKFFNIKARIGHFKPSAAVVVATIRALKMHGGVIDDLTTPNVKALAKGICNLEKHCENVAKFKVPFVVAINKFITDSDEEINFMLNWAKEKGYEISLLETWEKGGAGGIDLANKLLNNLSDTFTPLYDLELSLEDKIKMICSEIYGAKNVLFAPGIKTTLKKYEELGWGKLPICMAKTPHSFSDNPKKLGRPENFEITIRDVKPSIGAGFIVCLTGDIMTMPGLPKTPAANNMDIDENGLCKGLF